MIVRTFWVVMSLLFVVACGSQPNTATPTQTVAQAATTLTVMTHDSFAVTPEVLAVFEQQHNVKVTILNAGDAGSMLNKAILSKDAPLADVIYGIDNTFLSRALAADIIAESQPTLPALVDAATHDASTPLIPINVGYVIINYDVAALQAAGLTPPTSFAELLDPKWRGKLVVENPTTSSPGLAFFLATVAEYGADGWQDYWQKLRANDVLIVDDWSTAYYTHFSGSSGKGPRPLVVSYSSSPVAEVYFSEAPPATAPTANVAFGAFRQVEYAGVLKGSAHADLAQQFIEFMLSDAFQNDIPLQMFVYPASTTATLPDMYAQYGVVPAVAGQLDAATIAQNRDAWLAAWSTLMLQ
ncbi:MAG: thiamine ABC transporter substrate binding subunit [Roseiflexaceae bacterium]